MFSTECLRKDYKLSLYFHLYQLYFVSGVSWCPLDKREDHVTKLWHFLMPTPNARREKGIGQDPCVEKKQCQICDNFSEDQEKQLAFQ